MENMTLLERFANPDMIKDISVGEKLVASLQVTVLGMGVTFIALILLWGLIVVMTKLLTKSSAPAKVTVAPAPAATPVEEAYEENDEELVAVITAAIAASLQTSTHNIIVQNITRIGDAAPSWGRMGRMEQMNSRF